MTSYKSTKARVREVPQLGGKGLFAKCRINSGEVVCVKGGHVLTTDEFVLLPVGIRQHAMQIEENLFLGPKSESEIPKNSMYLNHSCEPNVGIRGQTVFVALRDIECDEQLSIDYAMMYVDRNAFVPFACKCGSEACRQTVTSDDWKLDNLQLRYRGYFVDFINQKLA
jgi:hypothetical protein